MTLLGCAVAYLYLGAVFARLLTRWLDWDNDDPFFLGLITLTWALQAPFIAAAGLIYGLGLLVGRGRRR